MSKKPKATLHSPHEVRQRKIYVLDEGVEIMACLVETHKLGGGEKDVHKKKGEGGVGVVEEFLQGGGVFGAPQAGKT